MAPFETENRSIFSGFIAITLLMLLLTSGVGVFLNANCQSRFWDEQLVYPGAEKVEEEAAFLGIQRVVYRLADALNVVEAWYAAEDAAQRRARVQRGETNLSTQNWLIEPDAQGGTILTLAAMCPSGSPAF